MTPNEAIEQLRDLGAYNGVNSQDRKAITLAIAAIERLAKFERLAQDTAECRWKESDDLPRGFDGWISGMYEEDFRRICSELAALAAKDER